MSLISTAAIAVVEVVFRWQMHSLSGHTVLLQSPRSTSIKRTYFRDLESRSKRCSIITQCWSSCGTHTSFRGVPDGVGFFLKQQTTAKMQINKTALSYIKTK